jgi:hypothetical protein
MRAYNESIGQEHVPRYFKQWHNPSDDQIYWVYNNTYFEQDRKTQDWSSLPDIFGTTFPQEVQDYLKTA